MRRVVAVGRLLIGVFVDDGSLALGVIAVVGCAAAGRFWLGADPTLVALLLAAGLLLVLIENVYRAAGKRA